MSAVLTVSDAHKSYGETKALDGAAMTMHKGEWLALLGPNGAGKTTLIRAIAGRVHLDRGSINLLGQSLNGNGSTQAASDVRGKLGVVPQDIALYPLLTARENLRAFGSLQGVGGSTLNDRVKWALEWTGLADRADSLSKTFSGGMKRRLNIACGVLHRPEVVLLDEPTVGVDPQSRERIWEMLGQLRDEGATLLLTTHQLDEAQQICDRIVIIDHGKAIADGTLDELVAKTIGRGRKVMLTLDREENLAIVRSGDLAIERQATGSPIAKSPDRQIAKSTNLCCTMEDVAAELPGLLNRVHGTGAKVLDVQIEPPSLHAVFLHLTGRELRE